MRKEEDDWGVPYIMKYKEDKDLYAIREDKTCKNIRIIEDLEYFDIK